MNREELKHRRVSGGFQKRSLYRRKIYSITGFSVLVALILYLPHTSFAQDPILSAIEASALNYDEGQSPTPITNSITVTDADSPLLTNATIQISNNFSNTEDLLQFADNFSIAGSYDPLTGTLTLTGPATPADFTSALRSVTYQNTNNNNPSNLARTISFSVNDGSSNSLTVTRDIQVNGINDAPTGQPDNFVIYEDTDLDCGCILINDTDPDGDDLIALHADPPLHGTVTDLGGFYIYTPYPDFYGTDTFTYYANDGTQNSAPISVNVTVLPVNDAPIAANDAATTNEDTPIGIPILSNDTDVDDVLNATMIVFITSPTHGTLTINTTTGAVVYSPNLNYNGNDSFTYQVKDAAGALSNIATVAIVIHPVNDAPIANADFATTPEETPVSIPVLANDTDVDSSLDPASLLVVTAPLNGQAIVQPSTGMIEYIPQENFTGIDSFTYTVKDSEGATSAPISVTISVSPVNDVPVAVNDQASTNEDTPVDINVLSNDTDVDNVLDATMIVLKTSATHGTLTINAATGAVVYSPSLNYNGNDSFTYQVRDAAGALSNIATVAIVILPVNDAPITNADFAITPEETPVSIPVLANDTDVDSSLDPASLLVVTAPLNGQAVVQPSTGVIQYIPQENFTGIDSFTYTVSDTQGATSLPILVTITVSPVNDAPVAVNDQASTNEDTPVDIDVLSNDIDVDNVLDAPMIVLMTSPTHGTLTINITSGVVVYSPNLNYNGNDSFTYQVKDAAGAFSNTATVAIVIHPVNDAPIANADFATTPEETPVSITVLANDTDVDSALDPASLLVVTAPLNGQAVVQPSTGVIQYIPQENFTGIDSFTYTVSDTQGATSLPVLVTITVSPVNDVPVAVNDEASTNENTPVDIDVISNDIDVDNDVTPGSVVITTNPVHGTIALNPVTGSVTYTPEDDFTGNDSFTYTLQDPSGSMSPPATVSVNIVPTPNQAPDAVDDGPIMNTSLSPIIIDVLANDHDDDDDELTLVSVTNPSIGTVKIVDGKIVYQPGGLTSETVTFTYTIQDPSGLSDEAVVTVENSYLPLVVSEGFSPNGTHNNETWFIQGIENYPNNSVKVFDRWGFLVYQKQHYENFTSPFDGRGNTAQQSGKLLDQGTYYYILDPGSEMKTMTGYVVIIR